MALLTALGGCYPRLSLASMTTQATPIATAITTTRAIPISSSGCTGATTFMTASLCLIRAPLDGCGQVLQLDRLDQVIARVEIVGERPRGGVCSPGHDDGPGQLQR